MTETRKNFTLLGQDGQARRGVLHSFRGDVQTPFFMPIATVGAIKGGVEAREVRGLGFELILSNTYHLHLRPGEERVKAFGGLARFMGWDGPILTDSGGFQAWSLAKMNQITEEGVAFKSHLDGSPVKLTPEVVIDIQHALGIDVAMALDECTDYPCDYETAKASMERSMRWAARCKQRWIETGANASMDLFGIGQGSFFKDLREESAKILADMDLPGYAVGGVVVDFTRTPEAILPSVPHLPNDRPRYLMGVGTPLDILNAVELGIDMFDCVLPTRNGRHGKVFTTLGEVNLTAAKWKDAEVPIDEENDNPVSRNYTRAYLRHLFHAGESLGGRLATLHNLSFYGNLMKGIRQSIEAGCFEKFKAEFFEKYTGGAG
ncbi:MAG: tRNA guanosine(34) transglycosylase Tgt [Verrucomicrobiae bacterium]|nr:tRNA guanosine(34) transglycosylase Tgt [Verrucomicrobiae bacterium]